MFHIFVILTVEDKLSCKISQMILSTVTIPNTRSYYSVQAVGVVTFHGYQIYSD